MILMIDNYDSFTFNLVHYVMELGVEVRVERNDALTADAAIALNPQAIIISPGPCTPNEAGISLDLVAACADKELPLLGVCLGHQAIGQHFGGTVEQGGLMHGKTSPMEHDGSGVFAGLPNPFIATRYHSLIVARDGLPDCLHINATTPSADGGDSLIMGFRHQTLPIHGVQFHPESIASEHGHQMLANFLDIAGIEHGGVPKAPKGALV
ncbi:anthranilate synthase component II [Alterisphingorhabdus coralli]|uniref:Aminodeoxychorismate/anthranilate synthase component II n=1 Tax=Alterisphingorhabdus coralli TaxID=3071408 RepID=A0AA97F6E1_9SPHN|nr:aminodeoxychorismate/anthranilate synthase component II [Parasphingorhabdus sp. SCSIO 66989]WOE73947.1 aminodeoxychorismate/anthranilate synthase component II [Parasphingorhabdus sp. SCSIO 66989]